MCIKAVNDYPSRIQIVPECYKIQEMCVGAVNTCYFVFDSFSNQYKTQKICDKAVDDYTHALQFTPDRFKTQKRVMMLLIIIPLYNKICF